MKMYSKKKSCKKAVNKKRLSDYFDFVFPVRSATSIAAMSKAAV
jgi:hypothetical protein